MELDRRGALAGATAKARLTLIHHPNATAPTPAASPLDGTARQQADQTRNALLAISGDALLRPFRAATGKAVFKPCFALGGKASRLDQGGILDTA